MYESTISQDPSGPDPSVRGDRQLLKIVSVGLATYCGFLLLARWFFEWEGHHVSLEIFAGMANTTAAAFLVAAVTAWLAAVHRKTRATVFGVFCMLALTTIGSINWWTEGRLGVPGKYMSPATAFCFICAAIGLLTAQRDMLIFHFAVTAGLILSVLALTGFLFDTRSLYQFAFFSTLAPQTAACFLVLFVAILLIAPHRSWIRFFFGSGPGSVSVQRLAPVTLITPFLLGVLTRTFEYDEVSQISFQLSVYAVLTMTLMMALVLLRGRDADLAHEKQLKIIGDLEQAVADRDLLMREVNHRVKNNLQQINALMSLQARKSSSDETKVAFASMSTRLSALAVVHRQLIEQEQPSSIDAAAFILDLCNNLSVAFGAKERGVRIRTRVTGDIGDLDDAVSIGLLANELLSNAFRHAFSGTDGGMIDVELSLTDGGDMLLTITDDGIGHTRADTNEEGIGSLIIRSLVQQLGATLERRPAQDIPVSADDAPAQNARPGTVVQIKIPLGQNGKG